MRVFQIESGRVLPMKGDILISSPFFRGHDLTRSVVLLLEHNEEGSMGIILNKEFRNHILLNELLPPLEFAQRVPIYKGGPVSRETIFFLHTLEDLKGAIPLANGLYVNGNFGEVQKYILDGKPVEGVFRFFSGYVGWEKGQLIKEIEEKSWLIVDSNKEMLQDLNFCDLWHTMLAKLGVDMLFGHVILNIRCLTRNLFFGALSHPDNFCRYASNLLIVHTLDNRK